ncbi:AAA family ATPase, partial [Providencia rettgeri]|uniref:AAA family ATPase n=1 Tax=Providencia rettgeri TaxID=587 RepID=UPI001BCCA33C
MITHQRLKKLKIESLFGYKDIELDLNDVNVLVGRNGLGKTTILKILNAMLSEDFNCKELKLCNHVTITFTNSEMIVYKRDNKIEEIATASLNKVINEFLINSINHDNIDFS